MKTNFCIMTETSEVCYTKCMCYKW